MTPEEELRFMAQTLGDAERTIICEPQQEAQLRFLVDQMGMATLWTVRASLACPTGKILVLDEQAMQASFNQTLQRAAHNLRKPR
ncbi:MAG: hypothetical protein HOY75_08430 [Streptomyces sp.]|nr:hypothetical protein [Streptomyces sp.]